jgi:hypothetical protein
VTPGLLNPMTAGPGVIRKEGKRLKADGER